MTDEDMPIIAVMNLGKFLPIEAEKVSELLRDRNRVRVLERLELEPIDAVGVLKRIFFSAKPEAVETELAKDLKSEFFSERLEANVNRLVRVRSNDTCRARPEVRVKVELRDLKSEVFSRKLEARVSEELRVL